MNLSRPWHGEGSNTWTLAASGFARSPTSSCRHQSVDCCAWRGIGLTRKEAALHLILHGRPRGEEWGERTQSPPRSLIVAPRSGARAPFSFPGRRVRPFSFGTRRAPPAPKVSSRGPSDARQPGTYEHGPR